MDAEKLASPDRKFQHPMVDEGISGVDIVGRVDGQQIETILAKLYKR